MNRSATYFTRKKRAYPVCPQDGTSMKAEMDGTHRWKCPLCNVTFEVRFKALAKKERS